MERRVVLTTERTMLTTWLPDDGEDLHTLHSDADTMRWIRPGRPESRDESRDRLATYLKEQEKGAAKWRAVAHSGRFLGRAGFGARTGYREIGYTLLRSVSGHGLATELTRALVAWHIAHPEPKGLPQLAAHVALVNSASRRVLEKSGFEFVAEREHNGMPSALYVWDSQRQATGPTHAQ